VLDGHDEGGGNGWVNIPPSDGSVFMASTAFIDGPGGVLRISVNGRFRRRVVADGKHMELPDSLSGAECRLRYTSLLGCVDHDSVRAVLGDVDWTSCRRYLYVLLLAYAKGDRGDLLDDGSPNLICFKNRRGVEVFVQFVRENGWWDLDAHYRIPDHSGDRRLFFPQPVNA
jgi:hypothetical protein